jgi:hypothetical protein
MMRGGRAGLLVLALCAAMQLAQAATAGGDLPPRGKRALLRWLRAGLYRERFVGEPEVHASTVEGRAHGLNVRTYYDPVLVGDLRAPAARFEEVRRW